MINSTTSNSFEFKNFNFTSELNISYIDIADFVLRAINQKTNLSKTQDLNQGGECDNYCNGNLRNVLESYKSIHGYISLVICIFGTIANIFNIIVLTRKDMCKQPINIILKWLSVADLFVLIEYIPFASYMYLGYIGQMDYKYSWAVYLLFHMHFTQILHTVSISLTVTLAIWRYIAIKQLYFRHPHGSFAQRALTHVGEGVILSFIISPILCLPTYFIFRIKKTEITENETKFLLYHLDAKHDTGLYRFNFWVHSILIKLVPCCILTIISFVLIRVLCQAGKRKVKLKGGYDQPNANLTGQKAPKTDRRTDRTTTLLVAVLLLFLATEFPQGILGFLSGVSNKCFFYKCYTLFGEVMDLLALINAAIGFVLYGLMSKQFRTSFKSVFFKKPISTIEMTRITGITTTCV